MITQIRKIGNSKGLIIPSHLIDKYNLSKVRIEEHADGILLVKVDSDSELLTRIDELRRNREWINKQMFIEASDPEVQEYYAQESKEFGDVDLDIVE